MTAGGNQEKPLAAICGGTLTDKQVERLEKALCSDTELLRVTTLYDCTGVPHPKVREAEILKLVTQRLKKVFPKRDITAADARAVRIALKTLPAWEDAMLWAMWVDSTPRWAGLHYGSFYIGDPHQILRQGSWKPYFDNMFKHTDPCDRYWCNRTELDVQLRRVGKITHRMGTGNAADSFCIKTTRGAGTYRVELGAQVKKIKTESGYIAAIPREYPGFDTDRLEEIEKNTMCTGDVRYLLMTFRPESVRFELSREKEDKQEGLILLK